MFLVRVVIIRQKKGVSGLHIEFDVTVFNDENEKQDFRVVFQCVERTDNLRTQSSVDMTTAAKYGCDADESEELEKFCKNDDFALKYLSWKADNIAKKWFFDNYKENN